MDKSSQGLGDDPLGRVPSLRNSKTDGLLMAYEG